MTARAARIERCLRGESREYVRRLRRAARQAAGGWPHTREQGASATASLREELAELGVAEEDLGDGLAGAVDDAVRIFFERIADRHAYRRPVEESGLSRGRILDVSTGRRLPIWPAE